MKSALFRVICASGDKTPPTITSNNTNSVAENATLSHSLTANESVTWSIVGGADQARFELSGSTLRWASNGTKDYEAPDDADTNNTYVVTVRATDLAGNTTDQTITVTVTDVSEGFYALAVKSGNATETVATWQTDVSDAQNIHDTGSNTSRFTVPAAWNGRYGRTSGNLLVTDASRKIVTLKNGASYQGQGAYRLGQSLSTHVSQAFGAPVPLATNDYFEVALTASTAISADDATWGQLELFAATFDGAVVYKSGNQAIGAGAFTDLTWDTELYDLNSWHDNVTNNTRLTVPSGVTLVRVSGNFFCDGAANDQTIITFQKDGADAYGLPRNETDGALDEDIGGISAPIAVSAGNYFTMQAFNTSAVDVEAQGRTWFCIEKLPATLKYALVRRSANQAITSGVWNTINWDTEVADTDNWHSLASTVTITIASPGVVTWTAHGLFDTSPVVFTTTGALPTGLTAGTIYYVRNATTDTFQVSATPNGSVINTSGSQSGTHTATNSSIMVVPSGVTRIRTGFSINAEASITGDFLGRIIKNGATFSGMPYVCTDTSGADGVSGYSGIIEVTAGDRFECQVQPGAAGNIGSLTTSWFSIEEVPAAA